MREFTSQIIKTFHIFICEMMMMMMIEIRLEFLSVLISKHPKSRYILEKQND